MHGDHDLAGASPRPTTTTTGDDEMATVRVHNGTQLVETEDGYYYLADDLGTPVSHGWRNQEDAEAALLIMNEAEWPTHDIELDERGYPVE